jgi:DNA-3-methyladenine glycosylase II
MGLGVTPRPRSVGSRVIRLGAPYCPPSGAPILHSALIVRYLFGKSYALATKHERGHVPTMKPTRAQIAALKLRDPVLGAAMKGLPPFPEFPVQSFRGPCFHVLARSIIYQQLATKAAATIYGRVRSLSSGLRFPTSEQMLTYSDERLRAAGLSRNKTKAIRDLADKITSGELRLRGISRCDDDEIIRRLSTVWGIGEWTAQMFLIFKLGRLDVMPTGDLGVQEGLRLLDGLAGRPSPNTLLDRAEVWRPLCSVAAWFLWRLADAR